MLSKIGNDYNAKDDDNSSRDDDHDDDYKNQDKRLKGLLMGHQSSFAKKKQRGPSSAI